MSHSRLYSAEDRAKSKIELSKVIEFSIERGGTMKEWARNRLNRQEQNRSF